MATPAQLLVTESRQLCADVSRLAFGDPVSHVYNPLEYARQAWETYLGIAAAGKRRVVMLGMNPGPWGMAQTGVPFGEVPAVRDWMGIHVPIGEPPSPHPKRPIEGFACSRSEVSGRRLWGLMRERFRTAEAFFTDHFVANYCPLVFMGESGRNITPDKLAAAERDPLFRLCDDYLAVTVRALEPRFVIGIGKFAEDCIRRVLSEPANGSPVVGSVLHPSPASPAANRGWAEAATKRLVELGVWEAN